MVRHKSRKRNAVLSIGLVGSALLSAVALVGCGGGSGGSSVTQDAILTGPTAATGTARVTLNVNASTISTTLNTTGLDNVVSAHIHAGVPGSDGPVLFTLYQTSDGAFPANLTKTLTAADFTPAPGIATITDAMGVIRGGSAYIDVHTLSHPAGELRGQIQP